MIWVFGVVSSLSCCLSLAALVIVLLNFTEHDRRMGERIQSLENRLHALTIDHYDLDQEFHDFAIGAGNYDDDEPDSHRDRDSDDEWDDPFADADDDVLGPALAVQPADALALHR